MPRNPEVLADLAQELPAAIRYDFRDAVKTLSDARRSEAWEALFKAVRWALERGAAPDA
jgi:hypothetical protein